MQETRRNFLRKALKIGTVASAVGATSLLANNKEKSRNITSGNSKKKEVLYYKSEAWEKYYKIVY